jgi:hypothetical protein
MPKGNMDCAGHIGHHLYTLSGPIYYEFNGGVTKGSYVCRIKNALVFGSRHTFRMVRLTFKMLWLTFKMLRARRK